MDPIRYIVETKSADGVIINQIQPDDPRVRYMTERGFPFATHGRTEAGFAHPYFDFDNRRFSELAVEELFRRGRRHLVLLAPPQDQTYARHMIDGFYRAGHRLGCQYRVLEGMTSDSSIGTIETHVAALMAGDQRPDGVIVGAASATMAVVAAAESAGRRLGRDFDIVSKEAVPFLRFFRNEIIVVHEDVRKAGESLAHALIQAIENKDRPALQALDIPALDG